MTNMRGHSTGYVAPVAFCRHEVGARQSNIVPGSNCEIERPIGTLAKCQRNEQRENCNEAKHAHSSASGSGESPAFI